MDGKELYAAEAFAPLRLRSAMTRLTDAEYAAWVAAAGARQLGRWIRAEIVARLADPPPSAAADVVTREHVAEIRRIGVNINQIARRLNAGLPTDASWSMP